MALSKAALQPVEIALVGAEIMAGPAPIFNLLQLSCGLRIKLRLDLSSWCSGGQISVITLDPVGWTRRNQIHGVIGYLHHGLTTA